MNSVFYSIFIFCILLSVIYAIKFIINSINKNIREKLVDEKIAIMINGPETFNIKSNKNKHDSVSSLSLDNVKKVNIIKYFSTGGAAASIILLLIDYSDFKLFIFILAYIIGLLVIYLIFANINAKKNKKFIADFPDTLDLMARSIVSGHSITNAITIVAENSSGILEEEFNNIKNNISLGFSLQEALEHASKHIKIGEFQYFTVITYVQQQTGGNIALLLSNLANSLRKKLSMEKKIKALSSESIASAFIIGSIPIMVITLISVLSPNYIAPLFTNSTGHFIILACILWQIIGILVMRKIIRIEI